MNVPPLDLSLQHEPLLPQMLETFQNIVKSGRFVLGQTVEEFESTLAHYCGATDAIGVSSGTDALLAALMALEIGPGDEVITTPYTFFATAGSIWRAGAKPVFVDIEPDTFNIDPAKIDAAVTDRTRAIMPVHLYGQMADMDPIMAVAEARGLAVIEDAAQAIGSEYRGRKAGAIGTIGCFSFFPSKNLGGFGDGGMCVTQDEALAAKLTMCRGHGGKDKYRNEFVGGNFRLDTLQAAALIVKLRHLDDWSAGRRGNAARYDELFADCDAVVTPMIRPENVSIYNQYVIRVPRRDELQAHLKAADIGTAIYYPISLHEQQCFASLGGKAGDFPVSEQAATEVLAIPVYSELTDEQIVYVATTIKEFVA